MFFPALSVAAGTSRASVDSDENQANDDSLFAQISADGRFAVFISRASNLVPGDDNGLNDVFLRDGT